MSTKQRFLTEGSDVNLVHENERPKVGEEYEKRIKQTLEKEGVDRKEIIDDIENINTKEGTKKTHSDYSNNKLVGHLHEVNKKDEGWQKVSTEIEDTIIESTKQIPQKRIHAELGAGSHPILSYPKLINKVSHIDWTDASKTELSFAQNELSDSSNKISSKFHIINKNFLQYLSSIPDNHLTSLGMKYCINYLEEHQMGEFFDLLHKKMKNNGILVANPGGATGMLRPTNGVLFYHNNNKDCVKKPVKLQDGDSYKIVFLNQDGIPQNKGTTKKRYSEKYFKKFENDKNGHKKFKINWEEKNGTTIMTIEKI